MIIASKEWAITMFKVVLQVLCIYSYLILKAILWDRTYLLIVTYEKYRTQIHIQHLMQLKINWKSKFKRFNKCVSLLQGHCYSDIKARLKSDDHQKMQKNKTKTSSHHKNVQQTGYRRIILQHNKGHIDKPTSYSMVKGVKFFLYNQEQGCPLNTPFDMVLEVLVRAIK